MDMTTLKEGREALRVGMHNELSMLSISFFETIIKDLLHAVERVTPGQINAMKWRKLQTVFAEALYKIKKLNEEA